MQGHEHRVAGLAVKTSVQLLLPGIQRLVAVAVVLRLVGEIVSRAGKGVKRNHMGPQGRGYEAGSHREVLVVGARKLLAVVVGALHRPRPGGWVQPGQGGPGLAERRFCAPIATCSAGQTPASAAQDRTDHDRFPFGSADGAPTARLCRLM